MVMTKRLLILTVLAVVLVGGGLFYYRLHNAKKPVTPVTAAVTRGDVVAKVDATGTLAAGDDRPGRQPGVGHDQGAARRLTTPR